MLICVLCLLSGRLALAQTITVSAPTSSTETFQADKPPKDLLPGEDADTRIVGGVVPADSAKTISVTWDTARSTLTVKGIYPISVFANITIRLPDNATQNLKDHENGHSTLMTEEYNRVANTITTTAFRGFIGTEFIGTGGTDAERRDNAFAQAKSAYATRLNNAYQGIYSRIMELNNKYDILTDHAKNPDVNSAQGMTLAKQERDRALQAGNGARQPGPQGPKAGAVDPPSVTYQPDTQDLVFTLDNALTKVTIGGITTNADALVSAGAQVSIAPMKIVGVQEDGTVLFDPSEMTINASNSSVLHGYLLDPVYMPSSVPGFTGMIQAYLDIPPSFTGEGIENTIGSDFLSSLQSILDDPTIASVPTFWFFTDHPLFAGTSQPIELYSTGAM